MITDAFTSSVADPQPPAIQKWYISATCHDNQVRQQKWRNTGHF